MRRARIKMPAEESDAVYHVLSRTVNGEWVLDATAKEILRQQMRQVAEFCGVVILTYVILSNHFHILVLVPRKGPVTDEELLRRYGILYPKPTRYQAAALSVIAAQLRTNGPEAVKWRERQLRLMNDVSQFMKLVKERFSIWFNARHDRFGPVWSDRFKSTLIDPAGGAIRTVAAYIDLNSVRAGIVGDPKDYRYCGYAEAVAGRPEARRGLQWMQGGEWNEAQSTYRLLLFSKGASLREGAATVSAEQLQEVIRQGGTVPIADVLRCRVRYFTEGAVLGGSDFVEAHVAAYRKRHGCGPTVKCRILPLAVTWGQLAGLRPIRGELLG